MDSIEQFESQEQQYQGQYAPPPQYQRQYIPPPRNAISPETAERSLFKGRVEYMTLGLLIYSFILYSIVIGDMLIHLISIRMTSSDKEEYYERANEFADAYIESATSMIVAVLVGAAFLVLFFIKALPLKEIFRPHSKMTFLKLMMIIAVLMGIQLPFMIIDPIVEWGFNLFGLTIQQAIESSIAGSTTVSMLLYASFIAPVIEELVYRGFVMHGLQRAGCGKVAAMVLSSMLFGIMHANPTQSVFAFFVGMVFSYTAIEYGIGWSMVLHFTNNFIFGDLMVFLEKQLPDDVSVILDYSLFGFLTLAAIVVLICNAKRIARFVKENRSPAKQYGWTFSCITFILFVTIHIGLTLLQIQILE